MKVLNEEKLPSCPCSNIHIPTQAYICFMLSVSVRLVLELGMRGLISSWLEEKVWDCPLSLIFFFGQGESRLFSLFLGVRLCTFLSFLLTYDNFDNSFWLRKIGSELHTHETLLSISRNFPEWSSIWRSQGVLPSRKVERKNGLWQAIEKDDGLNTQTLVSGGFFCPVITRVARFSPYSISVSVHPSLTYAILCICPIYLSFTCLMSHNFLFSSPFFTKSPIQIGGLMHVFSSIQF